MVNRLLPYLQRKFLLSIFFFLTILSLSLLLLKSLYIVITSAHAVFPTYALLGGVAGFAATALGSLPALTIKNLNDKTQNTMLGFAAGLMLAASVFSLLLPGLKSAELLTNSKTLGVLIVILGMILGTVFMLGLDSFVPHQHEKMGFFGPDFLRVRRVWLFVLAITLHNLPEGMAIGVSFAQNDLSIGIPLSSAIVIQDFPEGLAVAISLVPILKNRWKAVLLGACSGLMEPLGSLLGVGLASGFAIAYPISLGFAAAAMIFVVSHEVIPETHSKGQMTTATLGLMLGFIVMMLLDTALG